MAGYWNGEKALFQACIVRLLQDDEKPLWWQNAYVGQEIQAIEISYSGSTWRISNMNGTGYYKVTEGQGSPQCGHASLGKHEFVKYISPAEMTTKLDMEGIAAHNKIVEDFQRTKDPVQFEKIQSLKRMANKINTDNGKNT